ncbi:MAG: hypothetical protein IKN73_01540 [Alphaproteobacteria bacterium]|nr:hypothetical protein [Alphaproteobacteria bacterium]
MNRKFLLALLLCMPLAVFADDAENQFNIDNVIEEQITHADSIDSAVIGLKTGFNEISQADKYKDISAETRQEQEQKIKDLAKDAKTCKTDTAADKKGDDKTKSEQKTPEQLAAEKAAQEKKIKEAEDKYKAAKENEQSLANRTLTAATTAAMGIGGMELAMGLSEQKADKDAEADMKAYLSTFRCKYTDGKSFKGGPDPIELPGGNDEKLQSLKSEYIALAKDLKERKEALGMKPGIESEEILDKADMGLYDDENVGITSGNYASLYRANALNSEEDQAKLDAEKSASSKRVKGGAIAVGVGAGVGILGNSLINGKLGEALKNLKKDKKEGDAVKAAAKIEEDALKDLQKCLKTAGVNNTDKLTIDTFMPSIISVKNVKCKDLAKNEKVKGKDATELFADFDAEDVDKFLDNLIDHFGGKVTGQMIGVTMDEDPTSTQKARAKTAIETAIKTIQKRLEEAVEKDNKTTSNEETDDMNGTLSSVATGLMNKVKGGGGASDAAAGFDVSSLSGLIQ